MSKRPGGFQCQSPIAMPPPEVALAASSAPESRHSVLEKEPEDLPGKELLVEAERHCMRSPLLFTLKRVGSCKTRRAPRPARNELGLHGGARRDAGGPPRALHSARQERLDPDRLLDRAAHEERPRQ